MRPPEASPWPAVYPLSRRVYVSRRGESARRAGRLPGLTDSRGPTAEVYDIIECVSGRRNKPDWRNAACRAARVIAASGGYRKVSPS